MTPEKLETIVYEEYRKFYIHRLKNLTKGKLIFPKNNPVHCLKWVLRDPFPKIARACGRIGLSVSEKAARERQRKVKMNQFNI